MYIYVHTYMYTYITGCMCAAASGCKLYMCIHLCTSVNVSARASWVHITHICVCVWQSASTPPRIVCMLYTYKYIYLCVCVCMCVCVCLCVQCSVSAPPRAECVCACSWIYMYIDMYMCIHTSIHIHIHVDTFILIPMVQSVCPYVYVAALATLRRESLCGLVSENVGHSTFQRIFKKAVHDILAQICPRVCGWAHFCLRFLWARVWKCAISVSKRVLMTISHLYPLICKLWYMAVSVYVTARMREWSILYKYMYIQIYT